MDTENKEKMKERCDKEFCLHKFFQSTKRWNKRPFTTCIDCKPQIKRKDDRRMAKMKTNTTDSEVGGMYSSMSALTDVTDFARPGNHFSGNMKTTSISRSPKSQRRTKMQPVLSKIEATSVTPLESQSIILENEIFNSMVGWQTAKEQHHPCIRLRISIVDADYRALGVKCPRITIIYIEVVTYSGAQSCLWGLNAFCRCGLKASDLIQVKHRINSKSNTNQHCR